MAKSAMESFKRIFVNETIKDDLFWPTKGRKIYQIISLFLSEYLGVTALVILTCAARITIVAGLGIIAKPFSALFHTALARGFTYGAIYVCMAHISGLFLNPMLVVCMVVMGKMSVYRMVLYFVAEFAGGISGDFILYYSINSPSLKKGYCMVPPSPGLPDMSVFFYEFWGGLALSFLFCGCYDSRCKTSFDFSPVKFAFSLVALNLAMFNFTGCYLNPAVVLAHSVLSSNYKNLWIYVGGPLTAGILAPILYQSLFNTSIGEPQAQAAT